MGMWFHNQGVPAIVLPNSQSTLELTPLSLLPGGLEGGFTCHRLIASLSLVPVGANLDVYGSMGVYVAPRAATAPNPITDNLDWYWHYDFVERQAILNIVRHAVDIRTGRKVRGEDRTITATIFNNVGSATSIVWSIETRMWLTRS